MSRTLAPGKQNVADVLDLMFLMMESPMISVVGGGELLQVWTAGGTELGLALDCPSPDRKTEGWLQDEG